MRRESKKKLMKENSESPRPSGLALKVMSSALLSGFENKIQVNADEQSEKVR